MYYFITIYISILFYELMIGNANIISVRFCGEVWIIQVISKATVYVRSFACIDGHSTIIRDYLLSNWCTENNVIIYVI